MPEARGLVSVIAGYARTSVLPNPFDSERLARNGFTEEIRYVMEMVEVHEGITALKADRMGLSDHLFA